MFHKFLTRFEIASSAFGLLAKTRHCERSEAISNLTKPVLKLMKRCTTPLVDGHFRNELNLSSEDSFFYGSLRNVLENFLDGKPYGV